MIEILEKILEQAGLQLTSEQRQELAENLDKRINAIIIKTAADNMTEVQRAQLLEILKSDSPRGAEQIQEMTSKIPGLDEKIREAVSLEIEVFAQAFRAKSN